MLHGASGFYKPAKFSEKAGMKDEIAYKILTAEQFIALQQGTFAGAPVDLADGYIHLSTAEQVSETLRRHFVGQEGLVIAAVALAPFGVAVKWEASRGGLLFPHLYGPLTMHNVIAHAAVAWDDQDEVILPQNEARGAGRAAPREK